jgi:transcriptional regulator with XRE-family HTH domain
MPNVNKDMLVLARESRRLTQENLAKLAGVGQGTISKAEPAALLNARARKSIRIAVALRTGGGPARRRPRA